MPNLWQSVFVPDVPPRVRLSIAISPQEERRLNVAATRRGQSMRDYVWDAVQARLLLDGIGSHASERLPALTAHSDPVLARLWDNSGDAAYDDL